MIFLNLIQYLILLYCMQFGDIFELILNIIIMGNVCPCPKRMKKKQFTYDVHEETFQMDQNIQNIGEHSPKQEQHDNQNNILTEDLRSSEEGTNTVSNHSDHKIQHTSPKEQSVVVQHFEPVSSSNNLSAQIKIEQQSQSLPLIEHKPQNIVQQKPSFQANILKPKTIKKKYNPDDYRFINEDNSFKVKKIDSIKQQQYNIDNCKNSQYFIFDITANLYIDNCQNCVIFVAPCESTIFVRNSSRITLIAATKQFRTYECHDCVFSIYCKSQPVVQSSSNLQFTSFACPVYSDLPKQFSKKRFQPWNNHWSEIHNFTKKEGEKHFYLHQKINLQIDWNQAFSLAELQITQIINPIPLIVGDLPYEVKAEVLILVHKTVSDEVLQQKLKDVIILKGFQGVIAGQGKEPKRAILIDALDAIPQAFEQIGTVFTNPSEIETNKAKWFVSFGDQVAK